MRSEKTAITRTKVSAPVRKIIEKGLLHGNVLNFGEGKAFIDTDAMAMAGPVKTATGYDPYSRIEARRSDPGMEYDVVVCSYVLNTLVPEERAKVFLDALYRSRGRALFTVRIDKVNGVPLFDGVATKRGTFQTQLSASEWVEWMRDTLDEALDLSQVDVIYKNGSFLIVEVW